MPQPTLVIPRSASTQKIRDPKDGEMSCVVCSKPVKIGPRTSMVWVHLGGNYVVTAEESKRLNESGHSGSDLGYQAVGSDCVRNNPALKPYIVNYKNLE